MNRLPAGAYNEAVATDPYWKILHENWPHIHRLYEMYADKRPVILYDIQERWAYAHPYKKYRADLMSERSQASLKEQYEHAKANGTFVVFVRDNKKKKLKSYSVPIS